jgi:hypothetical protein
MESAVLRGRPNVLTVYLLVGRHRRRNCSREIVMTTELYWMTLTVFMTALFWVPYVLDRYIVRGFWPALAGTQPEGNGPQSVWAQRARRGARKCGGESRHLCSGGADRGFSAHLHPGDEYGGRCLLLCSPCALHRLYVGYSCHADVGFFGRVGRANCHPARHSRMDVSL